MTETPDIRVGPNSGGLIYIELTWPDGSSLEGWRTKEETKDLLERVFKR